MIEKTYWDDLGHNYQFVERPDIKIIVDMVLKDEVKSIMDFAVGSGVFPVMLRKAGYEHDYIGSDYAQIFLDNAKENNPSEKFIGIDLNKKFPLMDKSFDACVIIHGLEYVNNYFETLKEMKRVARKFIYLDMWQDLVEGGDRIRFTEAGKWNVNNYGREKFYASLKNLGLEVVEDLLDSNEYSKTNRILKLKIT